MKQTRKKQTNFNLRERILVTGGDFRRYEKVKKSRKTNMFDLKTVMGLAYLTEQQILYIMGNYKQLKKEFPKGGEEI